MTGIIPATRRCHIAPDPPRRDSVLPTAVLVILYILCAATDLAGQQVPKWNVTPVPAVEIGKTTGNDVYLFQSVESALFLPDGRIVVADAGFLDIRIYSPAGEFQTRMGGRGRGPGEFVAIGGIWLTPKTMIAVWDAGNQRITTFGPDGGLTGTSRVLGNRGDEGNPEVFLGSFGNGDAVLASLHFGKIERDVVPDLRVLGRFELDGEFRAHLGHVRGMWRFNRFPIPFSPMPWVAVGRDSVYVADGYEARVTVRDRSGVSARTIDLPRAAAVPADVAWSSLEAKMRRRGRQLELGRLNLEYLEQGRVPRQEAFPQVAGLLIDGRGFIWARAYDPYVDPIWLRNHPLRPASGGEWRVVRPDGVVVATVGVPANVRPLEVRGDRLLGVASDTLGVQRVVVHEIQR